MAQGVSFPSVRWAEPEVYFRVGVLPAPSMPGCDIHRGGIQMKPVTSNPALDAYNRVAATRVARGAEVKAPEGPSGVKPTQPEAAHVQISSEARELAAHSGQVRTEKVRELKAEVSAGKFEVDQHLVAQRLVDDLG